MLSLLLGQQGFGSIGCGRAKQAPDAFRQARPDLVLLDVMLPGRDGLSICRQIRAQSEVPVVMLAASTDTADVVAGLEAGADDYISKPFSSLELVARIRARLRHVRTVVHELLIGDLRIDAEGRRVTRQGRPIQLTPVEFDLLLALARRPGQVLRRTELIRGVLGHPGSSHGRLLYVHVQRLRSKIEADPEDPRIVLTVRGVGYVAARST